MPMPRTLKAFGREVRKLINSPEVFEILTEGDWGAGGCWILAEALARFLGPPARLLAVQYRGIPVDHVVVKYDDVYIDYDGAQTKEDLAAKLLGDRPGSPVGKLVPFTRKLQQKAEDTGIMCDPYNVKRLLSALNRRFG